MLSIYDVTYTAKDIEFPGTVETLRTRVLTNSITSAMRFVKDNDINFIAITRVYNEDYHSYP
jgi:hypothetical protein